MLLPFQWHGSSRLHSTVPDWTGACRHGGRPQLQLSVHCTALIAMQCRKYRATIVELRKLCAKLLAERRAVR